MNYTRFLRIVFTLLLIILPSMALSQNDYTEARKLLKDLISIPGVSTYEDLVVDALVKLLPEGVEYEIDDRNNLLVTIGSGDTELMFIAHTDEIGLEVVKINQNGTISVRKRGGSYATVWESKVVDIYTSTGIVEGIVLPREKYLEPESGGYGNSDILIYTGADSINDVEKSGIKKGDYIIRKKRPTDIGKYKIASGAVDDRAGCAAQLLALEKLIGKKLNNKVTFAWCVEEEIGLNGARYISNTHQPDYVFAVDTFVSSDAPRDGKRFAYTPLGEGAIVRAFDSSNLAPREVYNKVLELARKRSIPVQLGITNGGNDGSVFQAVGSIDLPLSWPGLYSHSFISVIDMRDFMSLVDLIAAISEDF